MNLEIIIEDGKWCTTKVLIDGKPKDVVSVHIDIDAKKTPTATIELYLESLKLKGEGFEYRTERLVHE